MKREFVQYLESIGFREPLLQRAEQAAAFFERDCGYVLSAIFVDEYVSKDGLRQYEALNFFVDGALLVATDFANKEDYQIIPLPTVVECLRLTREAFTYDKASAESRLNIEIHTPSATGATFKASSDNCTHLWNIFQQYYLQRVKEAPLVED